MNRGVEVCSVMSAAHFDWLLLNYFVIYAQKIS